MTILMAVLLTLSPWKGPVLRTATVQAAQFQLAVRGPAHARVNLDATGLPKGWIASFCTPHVCAPFHYALQLDGKGTGTLEFQAVRVDDNAPARARVTVTANNGPSVATTVTARAVQ